MFISRGLGTKTNLSRRRKSNLWSLFSLFYHFVGDSNIDLPRQLSTDGQGFSLQEFMFKSQAWFEFEFRCRVTILASLVIPAFHSQGRNAQVVRATDFVYLLFQS